jgi:hypothetical protein
MDKQRAQWKGWTGYVELDAAEWAEWETKKNKDNTIITTGNVLDWSERRTRPRPTSSGASLEPLSGMLTPTTPIIAKGATKRLYTSVGSDMSLASAAAHRDWVSSTRGSGFGTSSQPSLTVPRVTRTRRYRYEDDEYKSRHQPKAPSFVSQRVRTNTLSKILA